jgi:hypothetical protein
LETCLLGRAHCWGQPPQCKRGLEQAAEFCGGYELVAPHIPVEERHTMTLSKYVIMITARRMTLLLQMTMSTFKSVLVINFSISQHGQPPTALQLKLHSCICIMHQASCISCMHHAYYPLNGLLCKRLYMQHGGAYIPSCGSRQGILYNNTAAVISASSAAQQNLKASSHAKSLGP